MFQYFFIAHDRSVLRAVVAEMWSVWTISSSVQDIYYFFVGFGTEGWFRVLLL